MRTKHDAALSVRLRFSEDARLGPGKIALLEAIGRDGSIAAAARAMNMSERRALLLVESLDAMFDAPVVGSRDGRATLTPLGAELVAAYRALEDDAGAALALRFAALRTRMRVGEPPPGPPGQRTRGA
jgi:molybdate transport system regulatory protein